MQINNIDGRVIFEKTRSLPCFARFIFPTVGYDGWLYHCSQSSAPNFHKIALEVICQKVVLGYYNYDVSNFSKYLSECSDKHGKRLSL